LEGSTPMERSVSPSPIPLYYQIFVVLTQRISEGAYDPGERFPTEDQLAAEFLVSRSTIRQALDEMEDRGLVTRHQGRGTFVSEPHRSRLGQRFRGSFVNLIRETDRSRVREVEVRGPVELPPRVVRLLELEEGSGTIVRRTRLMDGVPFVYTVNYLPQEYGRLLSEAELRRRSLLHLLEDKGVAFIRARQSIRAQVADTIASRKLDIPFAAPVLFVERVSWGAGPRPIEVVQSWYRGDIYEYTVTLDRGGPPWDDLIRQLA
jgi:GntR family transcriptional regulator